MEWIDSVEKSLKILGGGGVEDVEARVENSSPRLSINVHLSMSS